MSYSDLPVQPGLPILVGFLAASLGSLMGPSLYYVSAFVDFFRPTHYVSINTVMNASKNYHLLNPPNKYLWWSNIGMVPTPSQSHFLVLYRTYEFINDESRKWFLTIFDFKSTQNCRFKRYFQSKCYKNSNAT